MSTELAEPVGEYVERAFSEIIGKESSNVAKEDAVIRLRRLANEVDNYVKSQHEANGTPLGIATWEFLIVSWFGEPIRHTQKKRIAELRGYVQRFAKAVEEMRRERGK